jgi:hypothetical protein
MANYSFGAGGLKLGEAVEVTTTGQVGILHGEVVHISGCNTYYVMKPSVLKDGRPAVHSHDFLLLRKVDPTKPIFRAPTKKQLDKERRAKEIIERVKEDGAEKNLENLAEDTNKALENDDPSKGYIKVLTEDNTFAPKGDAVEDSAWITEADEAGKEPVVEVDEGIGVEEIKHMPGTQVWNKEYGRTMIVMGVYREIYHKDLEYSCMYMDDDKEVYVQASAYALIDLSVQVSVYPDDKTGPIDSSDRYDFYADASGHSRGHADLLDN